MALPASLYSNVVPMPAAHRHSAHERKTEARAAKDAEARLRRKTDQANAVLDALEARAARYEGLIKTYQMRKALTQAKLAALEDRVIAALEDASLTHVAGTRTSMRLQPAPLALEVLNERMVPGQFMKPPKPGKPTPDKVAIKTALGANDEIDPAAWGRKLTSKTSLIRS